MRWLDGITNSIDMSLSNFWVFLGSGEGWEGESQPWPIATAPREARKPPRHAHGDLTSLAPHERLTEIRKGRGTRDQIVNICWIMEKAREFQKSIYFCFIDYAKAFACLVLACEHSLGRILDHCLRPNRGQHQQAKKKKGYTSTTQYTAHDSFC